MKEKLISQLEAYATKLAGELPEEERAQFIKSYVGVMIPFNEELTADLNDLETEITEIYTENGYVPYEARSLGEVYRHGVKELAQTILTLISTSQNSDIRDKVADVIIGIVDLCVDAGVKSDAAGLKRHARVN